MQLTLEPKPQATLAESTFRFPAIGRVGDSERLPAANEMLLVVDDDGDDRIDREATEAEGDT